MVFQWIGTQRIAWICIASLVVPHMGTCRADTIPAAVCRDAELAAGGIFRGQIRDVNGVGLSGQMVVLQHDHQTQATAVTNAEGSFAFAGLTGGTYHIHFAERHHVVRLWMPGTAPPGAAQQALFVQDEPLVRGQHPISSLVGCEPIMIGVLIAAAIAIPVALHNSGDDVPGS